MLPIVLGCHVLSRRYKGGLSVRQSQPHFVLTASESCSPITGGLSDLLIA